jgi:hypothetical protein
MELTVYGINPIATAAAIAQNLEDAPPDIYIIN